ncbi:MAG: phosphopyruvate hydratase [SAR202 cluster bacterium]|nr:phosphopyruvate hydratase [SAR202 cluster bacterium]
MTTRKRSSPNIAGIKGREVLDSRGNPTVEAEVWLSDGSRGRAVAPSGASTGSHEALELRDKDLLRFGGRGVLNAVANLDQSVGPALKGQSPFDQAAIDQRLIELDGTPEKRKLGANAILAASLAVARAAAASQDRAAGNGGAGADVPLWRYLSAGHGFTLPVPMFNILNGGRHASNSTDIQEFMVIPVGMSSFAQALRAGTEIYQALRSRLHRAGHSVNVGDEGGFAPSLPSNRDALEMVLKSVEAACYAPGRDVFLALDVAASELYHEDDQRYHLEREGAALTSQELVDLYVQWAKEYPIISIEDGLSEDDWEGWANLRRQLGSRIQLVGDDLLVTNIQRIQRAIDSQACNAVLLKPNQIGTLTETGQAFSMARQGGWGTVMSHRSGETEDTTIADLAVAWDVRQIKTGAPARSERVAKYNRLLRIEGELGREAKYAGKSAFDYLHIF